MIGTTIGGKYAVVRQLGEGGMGAVYEARHTGTGRRVAIKVITGSLEPELLARFEIEAKAAGAIESEHIAQVLDVGRDEALGVPFMVMEFLVGEDLSHLFARLGPIPSDLALRIGVQACLGLEKAHAQGIVHRDVKPANLFLTERDAGELRVKVLDFGIAKVTAGELEAPTQKGSPLTRMGAFIGSPFYMSPEQTRGNRALDHRTDIWSLGIVLYQALAGRTPFEDAASIGDFVASVCTTPPPPIRTFAPWVEPAIALAVERALVIDPAGRYQSAAEMRAAFEAYLPLGASIRARSLVSASPGGPAAAAAAAQTIAATPTPMGTSLSGPPTAATVAVGTPYPGYTQPGMQSFHPPAPSHPSYPSVAPAPFLPPMPPLPVIPPKPPKKSGAGGVIAGVLGVAAVGGLVTAFAMGWIGNKSSTKDTSASAGASASAPPPVDTAAAAAALSKLVGTWKSDSGVIYDAVQNGESVEMRIRDADSLSNNGYVSGDTHFALRAMPGELDAFRVAARIRPAPPKGLTYDKRARTTCENTWRQANGKQLRAELEGEKLEVKLVRVEPAATTFTRDGTRVVGCTGLADAKVTEVETVLTRASAASTAAPPPKPVVVQPKPADAGAPPVDAGPPQTHVDAGPPQTQPPFDAGVPQTQPPAPVDAGSPADPSGRRPVGAACRRDGHCQSNNCTGQTCQSNGPGARCIHGGHCASRRCQSGVCQ
ncbi:Serine/threonine protein kinase [Minicystis rosea]|nr:Serine/threonine protein kinase [Minicystis rosea]